MREQGFGCMGWSAFYKTVPDEEAVAVFEAAGMAVDCVGLS